MTMDNEMVTEEETALAVRMAACSRIAYVTILAHSRTDTEKPRTLSLEPTANVLMTNSRNKPVKFYEDDKKWFYAVSKKIFILSLIVVSNYIPKLGRNDYY